MLEKQLTLFDTATHVGDIKAISLWQPWASLIYLGLKQYETRSWQTNYRGELVICSAKKKTKQQQQQYSRLATKYQLDVPWDNLPFGKAIAICELTDCVQMTKDFIQARSSCEIDSGDWITGRYAWKLDNIRVLAPIPVKGKQGLWNIELSSNGLLEDSRKVSPTNAVGDTENQALQRFLARAKVEEEARTKATVKTYQPNGRKTEYFRLDYRIGKKVKSIHIPGGNIRAKLSQDRAKELQFMIDRGAEIEELIATLKTYHQL